MNPSSHPAPPPGDYSSALPEEPRRRLSFLRVLIALVILLGSGTGVALAVRSGAIHPGRGKTVHRSPVFAPYVDVTLTPPYSFQDRTAAPVRSLVLGFVVSDPKAACSPSWGGFYSFDQAAKALDLDRRVAQARGQGASVLGSFGGQANSELATGCTNQDALVGAYRSVLDRYHLAGLDFDIEGTAVDDTAATDRRAEAVRTLQREVGRKLPVWLTLPLAPQGLPAGAIDNVRRTLAAGVALSGVNLLAMDYGPPAKDMFTLTRGALVRAERQLAAVFAGARIRLTPDQLWGRIGATVMIGENDSAGESFTPANARSLAAFAASHHLGRLSIWSLNRDRQCGVTFPLVGTHSNLCSGVRQEPLEFTRLLSRRTSAPATAAPAIAGVAATPRPDNPARSPYPIWQPVRMYQTHYKVVWHEAVYEARYFSQGQPPDQPLPGGGPGPWQLIGPVLPTDHAPVLPRLRPGTYPGWDPHRAYRQGDRVLVGGLPYVAKWYSTGTPPNSDAVDPSASPWKPLYTIPGEPSS